MWFAQAECLFEMYCYVVALFGGPGDLYTAVASSSTDYGRLFAEYQDAAQHEEESGKYQLIMMASMKIIRAVALFGGLFTAVTSSSTEYGLLFANKEELGKHQLIMMASMMKVIINKR
jgi:hypothetical protein